MLVWLASEFFETVFRDFTCGIPLGVGVGVRVLLADTLVELVAEIGGVLCLE